MKRAALLGALALVIALVAPAGASGAIRLARGDLVALTSTTAGAYAAVEAAGSTQPYVLVRSTGRGRSIGGRFGDPRAEWVDLAGAPDRRVAAGWGRPTSPGFEQKVAFAPALGDADVLGIGTGPAQLVLTRTARVLAYADRRGDVVVATATGDATTGAIERLTDDAPEVRHAVRDAVRTRGGLSVLDRAQTRSRTWLQLLGPGALPGRVFSVNTRSSLDAVMNADQQIAVNFRGRVYLLRRTGGRWTRTRLPGPGGMEGAPAFVSVGGGRSLLVYAQRVRGLRQLLLARVGRTRTPRVIPIQRTGEDDSRPFAARAPRGRIYVGWTRRQRGTGRHHVMLDVVR